MSNAKDRLARILAERRAQSGAAKSTDKSNQGSDTDSTQDTLPDSGANRSTNGGTTETKLREATHTSSDNNVVPGVPTPEPTQPATRKVTQVIKAGHPEAHPLALKLWELEEALDKQMPDRAMILKHIHDSLKVDPTVVTLLTDEAIGIIVKGLTDHTNTTIVAAPKKATAKRSQPLSLDLLD